MKLLDNDLINRYIYYLCRYIPYDKKENAKDEVLKILEENLSEDYDDKDIKTELNKLGNPYEIGLKYNSKGNFFLSGKNYEIFHSLVYLLGISALIAMTLFFFNYFSKLSKGNIFELIKTFVVTIILFSIFPSWVAEKVKTTKILRTLMEPWTVDDLFESKALKQSPYNLLKIIAYGSMFFLLQLYMKTSNIQKTTYYIILSLFFLNILRDCLKISEDSQVSNVFYVAFIIDLLTIVVFAMLLRVAIPNLFSIRIIIFVNFLDMALMGRDLIKNRNIINLRKKRRREKINKK
ncbi:hypothetical protein [Peptoniphilus raoultii]|uniref:hypothetical protein n=1 Tax=Peptoniphilus raoultii TaxID=1776387 RepID=UPI0008DA8E83|nr:hypothetical protein [Peptoniphilus raoultii]